MNNKCILITGSSGLIGSESVSFFCSRGFEVFGIDNDIRAYFFGRNASTAWNGKLLKHRFTNYHHFSFDIRDEYKIEKLFKKYKFYLIIHTAAQPSHDWSAKKPLTDFSINATATLMLLENFRKYAADGVFIFTSTNKVYGSNPNILPFVELDTRFELLNNHRYTNGINESMSIDHTIHSLFGASKTAADILVQEYGKYFGLNTVSFRCGCVTGPAHAGSELHGFLSYLVRCIAKGKPYTIFGYKGKQVRDNIHSYDLVNAMYNFFKNPKKGEVYNMGGSRFSNISIIEAIKKIEKLLNKKARINYVNDSRKGDHIWYISDISKFKSHYPTWHLTYSIDKILQDLCSHGHIA